ncbi:unnamed protein product [Lupinus luteus]|uniref:RING-type domain-containing protein n=1 Tax=Lupinus luteus TaxID=3873 RepID=A0AAV1XDM0_LUPLU
MDTDNPFEYDSENDGFYETSLIERYDLQQVAKWAEHMLPFLLLLLAVFLREHFQGVFIMIFTSVVMFKSNGIVKKQTALKEDRRASVLAGFSSASMLYVLCIYWLYRNDDLAYPLVMFPLKETPSFWHAIFTILVNDALVRQAAMALKCMLLISFKNCRRYNFLWQGKMLTLVEHTLLLYRALLPISVWNTFFMNKDYGALFSSVMVGLYLTFKLSYALEKVRCFFYALKSLSESESLDGIYSTTNQVNDAGDICAICHDRMYAPTQLLCKHMFCEDCVCQWFERRTTCPLCRAVVSTPHLKTFSSGSTSLFYQFC